MSLSGPFKSIKINKMLKGTADPQAARAELENFYSTTDGVYGVKANSKFVIAESGLFHAMLSDDVVLVYILRKGALSKDIPTSFVFVSIVTSDGKDHLVSTRNMEKSIELIDYLFPLLPKAAFGYSFSVDKAFSGGKRDGFQSLRQLAQKQHEEYPYKDASPYAAADTDPSVITRTPGQKFQMIPGKYFEPEK